MKYLVTSDWHVRATSPAKRIEGEYWWGMVLKPKIKFILDYAKKNNLPILHGGDLFDKPTFSSIPILNELKEMLSEVEMYIVPGNHDVYMRQWDNFDRTALKNVMPPVKMWPSYISHETIENYTDNDILLIHRFVSLDKIDFIAESITVDTLLDMYKIPNLIITGDNHMTWAYETEGRLVLNTGSLTRNTIAQKEHKPVIFVVDSDTLEFEEIEIPIKNDVWREDVNVDYDFDGIADKLKDGVVVVSFEDIVRTLTPDNRQDLKDMLSKWMEV